MPGGRKPRQAPEKPPKEKAPRQPRGRKPHAVPEETVSDEKAHDPKPAVVEPEESTAQVASKESTPLDHETQELLEQIIDECLAEQDLPDGTPQVGDAVTPATLGGTSCSVDAAEPLLEAGKGSGGCGALASPSVLACRDGAVRMLPADDGVMVLAGCGGAAPLFETAQGDGADISTSVLQVRELKMKKATRALLKLQKACLLNVLVPVEGSGTSSASGPAPSTPKILRLLRVPEPSGSGGSSQGMTQADCDNAGDVAPKSLATQGAGSGAEACHLEATSTETAAASAADREFAEQPPARSQPSSRCRFGPSGGKGFWRDLDGSCGSSDSGEDVVSRGFSPMKRPRYADNDESSEDLAPQFDQLPPAVADPLKTLAEDEMGERKFDHLQTIILKMLSKLTIEQRIGMWNKLRGPLCREAPRRPVVCSTLAPVAGSAVRNHSLVRQTILGGLEREREP